MLRIIYNVWYVTRLRGRGSGEKRPKIVLSFVVVPLAKNNYRNSWRIPDPNSVKFFFCRNSQEKVLEECIKDILKGVPDGFHAEFLESIHERFSKGFMGDIPRVIT